MDQPNPVVNLGDNEMLPNNPEVRNCPPVRRQIRKYCVQIFVVGSRYFLDLVVDDEHGVGIGPTTIRVFNDYEVG
jgi:hypothetical protein